MKVFNLGKMLFIASRYIIPKLRITFTVERVFPFLENGNKGRINIRPLSKHKNSLLFGERTDLKHMNINGVNKMGAAFAIQVMTGKENNVKKLMEWAFARSEQAQNWVKAVHTLASSTQRLVKSGLGKVKEKPLLPGYVFIEMKYVSDANNQSAYLPAELWHLIKGIPGVIRQFTSAGQIIGADVFEELSDKVEAEQVEVVVPVTEQEGTVPEVVQAEKAMRQTLHEVNMTETPTQRAAAEERLEEVLSTEQELIHQEPQPEQGPIAEQLEVLKQEAQNQPNKVGLLAKAKSFLKNQKEVLQVPKTLFMRYWDVLMSDGIPDSVSVVQRLLDALARERDVSVE